MIKYIKLEVQIHGLKNEPKIQPITDKIKLLIMKEFDLDYLNDVDIEVIEHAGEKEK